MLSLFAGSHSHLVASILLSIGLWSSNFTVVVSSHPPRKIEFYRLNYIWSSAFDSTFGRKYSTISHSTIRWMTFSYQFHILQYRYFKFSALLTSVVLDQLNMRMHNIIVQTFTIEQHAHSDDQRLMVGHSHHQPLTIKQHAYCDDRLSMVGHSNHQPLTIEQHAH